MVFAILLIFFPVAVVLLVAALLALPRQQPRVFAVNDRIRFTHWPGRTATVTHFWNPVDAARAFPNGVKGAAGPPYVDGVVRARFDDHDLKGMPYPYEVAAGTSVQRA